MTRDRRNNLIITLTILVVLIGVGSTYIIMKANEPTKKDGGIELVFAADSGQNQWLDIDKFKNMRTYVTFSLTTDSISNIKLLEQARQKINLIKQTHDTINGVHVHLDSKTPYHFFIKAVDIFREQEPHAFAPHDYDIYAWYLYITPKDQREPNKMDK